MTINNLIISIGCAFVLFMGLLLVVALYNQGKLQRAYARELRDFEQCVSCNVVTHIHRDEDIARRK